MTSCPVTLSQQPPDTVSPEASREVFLHLVLQATSCDYRLYRVA